MEVGVVNPRDPGQKFAPSDKIRGCVFEISVVTAGKDVPVGKQILNLHDNENAVKIPFLKREKGSLAAFMIQICRYISDNKYLFC